MTFDAKRWKMPGLVAVSALVLVGLAHLGGTTGGEADPQGPLPFDPLSSAEEAQALETALADPRVGDELGRHEAIGAALNTDKHRMKADPGSRVADVWFYDYDTDRTVYAMVDLLAPAVVEVAISDEQQPPITAGEVAHASTLALADEAVQAELEARGPHDEVGTTGRLWSGTTPTACPVHRCALVGFFLDGEWQPDLFVRVNLSLDEVEGIVRPGAPEDAQPGVGV